MIFGAVRFSHPERNEDGGLTTLVRPCRQASHRHHHHHHHHHHHDHVTNTSEPPREARDQQPTRLSHPTAQPPPAKKAPLPSFSPKSTPLTNNSIALAERVKCIVHNTKRNKIKQNKTKQGLEREKQPSPGNDLILRLDTYNF